MGKFLSNGVYSNKNDEKSTEVFAGFFFGGGFVVLFFIEI